MAIATHTQIRNDAPVRRDQVDALARSPWSNYPLVRRVSYFLLAGVLGVCIAGFWNFRAVDGFGTNVVVAGTIGDYQGKASQSADLGAGFGFIFALVAGLAATFTACNCVAFAMMPALACVPQVGHSLRAAWRPVGIMILFVVLVSASYGAFVGALGLDGAAAINTRAVRSAQAGVVFSTLGLALLFWSAIEFGLLSGFVKRCSPVTRAFFAQPTTKAALAGMVIGAFAIGRPYPVFREFLLYTAQLHQPVYGAAFMAAQGVGQIAVMITIFLVGSVFLGARVRAWVSAIPGRASIISAFALATGGAFFLFYWGIARAWPSIGRWGFQLGWYS